MDNLQYPDDLNPFGSEDESLEAVPQVKVEDYPDHLSPFGEEEDKETIPQTKAVTDDNYDNSLNPFSEDETSTPQPESPEPPPVPLPRTKSLLKKEMALKNRQRHSLTNYHPQQPPPPPPPPPSQPPATQPQTESEQLNSLPSLSSSSSLSNQPIANGNVVGQFQRKKNKRNAPPVPINFKREVSGSLNEIEEELNAIGDKLELLESESITCQETLKSTQTTDEEEFTRARAKFAEVIKRKNSIVRRQRELMYRKREMKLDQIHSDIEYELRMIGNKQLSHRTVEDEDREKELLKKLVEIVEEKNDIVENLNKDTSCDSQEIEEALRRLDIVDKQAVKANSLGESNSTNGSVKSDNCDKKKTHKGVKFSKIATLLPKGGPLKGTMRIKPKRFFKKYDSSQIDR